MVPDTQSAHFGHVCRETLVLTRHRCVIIGVQAACGGFTFEAREAEPTTPIQCYVQAQVRLNHMDMSNSNYCTGASDPSDCPYNLYRVSGDISGSFGAMLANLAYTLPFLGEGVRIMGRSIVPQWGSIRFRPLIIPHVRPRVGLSTCRRADEIKKYTHPKTFPPRSRCLVIRGCTSPSRKTRPCAQGRAGGRTRTCSKWATSRTRPRTAATLGRGPSCPPRSSYPSTSAST